MRSADLSIELLSFPMQRRLNSIITFIINVGVYLRVIKYSIRFDDAPSSAPQAILRLEPHCLRKISARSDSKQKGRS